MADFRKALEEGFEAARKADAAKNEINEVFENLRAEVLSSTGNKVSIERKILREDAPSRSPFDFQFPPPPPVRYWAIVAFNPSTAQAKTFELARWEMDRAGYPCTVTWSNQKHICEDKEALTNALLDLLKDPVVGERLHTLTKLEPPKMDEKDRRKNGD